MKRCKICHVEAELEDGRCHSCRLAKEASDHHMTYGKYKAIVEPYRPREATPAKPKLSKCKWCGGEFTPGRKGQVYCSDDCRHAAKPPKEPPAPKKCELCGKEFIPWRNSDKLKYCSQKCNYTAQNRRVSEQRRLWRER